MAVKVVVEGTDVMGSCVDPSLATSVDSCTAQMSMTVSAKDCSYPVIIIVDQAPLFTSPRVSPRSARLDLHAVIDIDCQTTLRNTKVLRLVFSAFSIASVNFLFTLACKSTHVYITIDITKRSSGWSQSRSTNPKWRTAAILQRPLNRYLCNRLTDFDEIWRGDAYWTRTLD